MDNGLTVMLAAVEPVDQRYPLYRGIVDRVVLVPLQIGFTLALITGEGSGLTVIVRLAAALQPLLSVTVTAYTVLLKGLTVTLEAVEPVDQTYPL